MAVDVEQCEWNGRHDVGAMNETEGDVAEPRRIVAEECLTPVPRAANGVDKDLSNVSSEGRGRSGKDCRAAAQAMPSEEHRLLGRGPMGVRRPDGRPVG